MLPHRFLTRRDILKTAGTGFGYLALAGLSNEAAAADRSPLATKHPHFPARAKRIIMLTMRGGPSHMDTFDYKPALQTNAGKTVSQVQGRGRTLLASPFKFARHGKSGLPISELFPHVARHADDLCLINSLSTDVPDHNQSFLMLHTGEGRVTRPSMGAWLLYGLGTENQDLPGFVTISPPSDWGGALNYGNSFLSAGYQATRIGEQGRAVANAQIGNLDCRHLTPEVQRMQVDLIQAMNQGLLERNPADAALEGVINSFELGFRMQTALPEALNISKESPRTLAMYGIRPGRSVAPVQARDAVGPADPDDFGRQCLMARRLVESGVRFVECCLGNWDTHRNIKAIMPRLCGSVDQPIAALLTDLKQRGLLDDTLVIWGGEFGRSPTDEQGGGRDHNSDGFTMWLAGGGVRGGQRVGATDENGARAVENKCNLHDLHATVLHLMGLDHQRLSYRYGGRDYTLTDIHGRVIREVMA